eukprot:144828-Chlamydomonas_euryale.AAC.1
MEPHPYGERFAGCEGPRPACFGGQRHAGRCRRIAFPAWFELAPGALVVGVDVDLESLLMIVSVSSTLSSSHATSVLLRAARLCVVTAARTRRSRVRSLP